MEEKVKDTTGVDLREEITENIEKNEKDSTNK